MCRLCVRSLAQLQMCLPTLLRWPQRAPGHVTHPFWWELWDGGFDEQLSNSKWWFPRPSQNSIVDKDTRLHHFLQLLRFMLSHLQSDAGLPLPWSPFQSHSCTVQIWAAGLREWTPCKHWWERAETKDKMLLVTWRPRKVSFYKQHDFARPCGRVMNTEWLLPKSITWFLKQVFYTLKMNVFIISKLCVCVCVVSIYVQYKCVRLRIKAN